MDAFLARYTKPFAVGLVVFALVLGVFKYWLHLDPAKGWGIVSLIAAYAGYLVYKKISK